jgi:tetratricopeptide (TPR) repeat protein
MDKAMDILNTNLKTNPYNPNLNSVYAIILAKKGQHTEAAQKKELALEYSKEFIHAHHVYFHLAITASLMNDRKEAVIWLRKSAETGFPNYPLFNGDPNLKNLKGDPDFDELLNGLRERYDHFQNL